MITTAARVIALMLAFLATAVPAQTPPPEIEQLRALLASPEVQGWLAAPAPAETAVDVATEPDFVQRGLERVARHRDRIGAALPALPGEVTAGLAALREEAADRGILVTVAMILLLVGAGLLVEWRFLRATRTFRKQVLGSSEDTVPERLRKLGMRVFLAAGAIASFAAGSLGVLMLLPLPPLAFGVAARVIVAVLAFRILLYVARILIAPGAPARRVIPMPEPVAEFWMARVVTFGAIAATAWGVGQSFGVLGASNPTRVILSYGFFALLTVLTVTWIWQRRARDLATLRPSLAATIFWSVYTVMLFLLWLAGMRYLLAPVLVAGLLPLAIGAVNRAVNHLLREGPLPEGEDDARPPSVLAAVIERGARISLIIGAAALLLAAWDISIDDLVSGEGRDGTIARVVIYLTAVGVIFDFIWHVTRTAIDKWIAGAQVATADPDEARRRAKLRTLLPILKNVLQATFAVIGVLMALAAVGVNIAPLIAGAGIFGVAIGFGAQNTVRDVMAGMFYLLDDAFRVGEYIVTGAGKGRVESFSIRSIKLRHHRGPVYTIPFGDLGAIQNLSRDWVIDKQSVTVVYGTDVAKAKKVIKKISADLLADPALGPSFLEPVKLQGVDALGDHGIVLRVKFMAKPGEQFTIRRRMLAAIEKEFAANGIEIAFPTVVVKAEDEDHEAAVNAAAATQAATAPPAPAAAT